MIARLTPAERQLAARYAAGINADHPSLRTPREPAMGTLDERLDIIIRRLGGRTGPIKLTPDERRLVESYRQAA